MQDRKILVTGGAGYLGSIVTKMLLEKKQHVVVLDSMIYSDVGIKGLYGMPGLSVIVGDIRDASAVRKAMRGVTEVVHLAAIANDPSGELNPELTRQVNYGAYSTLLALADEAGVSRFVNASTTSVYGKNELVGLEESSDLHPLKEYSICKAKAEELVVHANSQYLCTTSLRCATICGWSDRMRFDLILNLLTAQAIMDARIVVQGGQQQRPHIYIYDIAECFLKVLDAPASVVGGEIFNACGENVSIRSMAESIQERVQKNIELIYSPGRRDERSYNVSSNKIIKALGEIFSRSVYDAVEEIMKAHERRKWKNYMSPMYNNILMMKDGADEYTQV